MNKRNLLGKQKNVPTAGEQTAQEFINVSDISGTVLYTKDGYAFSYLNVSPICRELMTVREQYTKGQTLISQLKAVNQPFKLLKLNMPIDVSAHIQHYAEKKDLINMSSPKNRIIEANIAKLDQIATNNKTVTYLYYICIWESANQAAKLADRINEMKIMFENAGIKAEICKGREILTLCNLFTNPAAANEQQGNWENLITLVEGAAEQ